MTEIGLMAMVARLLASEILLMFARLLVFHAPSVETESSMPWKAATMEITSMEMDAVPFVPSKKDFYAQLSTKLALNAEMVFSILENSVTMETEIITMDVLLLVN